MKSFKQYSVVKLDEVKELLEKESSNAAVKVDTELPVEPDNVDQDVKDPEEKDSEIGEWIKVKDGWVVRFVVGGVDYSVSFWPVDENELHWNFVYFKTGQRDSSDIRKFGEQQNWKEVWSVLNEILKDFIRIFHPETIKFVGMSISKRGVYYKELFKIHVENFRNAFRRLGYHSSFDYRNISQAPSFVIKKGHTKDVAPEEPKKEVKPEEPKKEETEITEAASEANLFAKLKKLYLQSWKTEEDMYNSVEDEPDKADKLEVKLHAIDKEALVVEKELVKFVGSKKAKQLIKKAQLEMYKGTAYEQVEEEKLGYLGVDYEFVTATSDRKIWKGIWIQPEKYRKAGDDGKYFAFNVEFLDPKTHKYDGSSIEARYKDEVEGMKWARSVKHPPEMSDDYVKRYGTAAESKTYGNEKK